MKLLVLTLAVLAFVFSMPAEIGKRNMGLCCPRNGTCHQITSRWVVNCLTYQCKSVDSMVYEDVVSVDCGHSGSCHPVNSTWTVGCTTYKCITVHTGFRVQPILTNCTDHSGLCQDDAYITPAWNGIAYYNCSCFINRTDNLVYSRCL